MRMPVLVLFLLAIAAIASVKSQGTPAPPSPDARVAGTLTMTSAGVHDVSDSLRGMRPQKQMRTLTEAEIEAAAGMSEGNEIEERQVGAQPGIPDNGAAEQTSFGPRPAIPAVVSYDNGLNGGSTSDNNIAAGPDQVVVMRNSQFKVMTKAGGTLLGPVNNNSIFAGTNEVQQVALTGYTTDGSAYRLSYGGAETVPITRGQNNTAAGIQAALQGGNEQQQVVLSGFAGTGSYTLNYGGVDSVPFVRGTNHTAAAILAALNGPSEVQTVGLTDYATDGDSYTLSYEGRETIPIVRGSNDTAAGIQNALQGGNEVQAITFTNFNAANPGNTFRLKIGDKLSGPLGFATALGDATPVTSQNVSDKINAIFGFPGTVTVTGASNTAGPTITFAGDFRGQGRPAGRDRVRRLHRRTRAVQRVQPRGRQGRGAARRAGRRT